MVVAGLRPMLDAMTIDTCLPMLNYLQAHHPEEAHCAIASARRHGPITSGPLGLEILSYDLVRAVLRDPRFAVAQRAAAEAQGVTEGPLWQRITSLILAIDGDRHHRQRRLVAKAFTPRAVARLDAAITEVITDLLDTHVPAGRCDVVADIARPFPVPIICSLLGAPRQDWQLFSDWVGQISKMFEFNLSVDGPRILAAWQELDAYLERMVACRRHELTDDLISELIRAEDDGATLDHDELLALSVALLGAGTDTTRNQLAAAIDIFCDHPDQWALLGAQPALASQAVDEVMRYRPIGFSLPRVAIEDVELAGVPISAGTLVFVNTAAANRDPAVFHEPERFDITRENATGTLTFGNGAHYCLGSHLARLELTQALSIMAQRMPNLRRTGPAPWPSMLGVIGPSALPVAFGRF
ncbi:cytochrome P450 [Mycobacterium sp. ST-F2]|uniref:cytochrome P450 n=1 Tax=Mycobacterium sp. ST-F2 TaxID=1490484 RepID=UPI00095AADB7|nr:cytochrome P450 [Mycobacterium sp. ST-F2]OKH79852.1 cytochrome P450 [Mycobacterium sp. ST-F2]